MYTFKLLSGHPSDEILGRTDAWTYVRGYNTYIYAHTKTQGEAHYFKYEFYLSTKFSCFSFANTFFSLSDQVPNLLVHVGIQFLLHLKEHWRSYSLDVTVISTFPITEFIFLFVCKLCWSYKAQFIQFPSVYVSTFELSAFLHFLTLSLQDRNPLGPSTLCSLPLTLGSFSSVFGSFWGSLFFNLPWQALR